jgi:hypothetical protein
MRVQKFSIRFTPTGNEKLPVFAAHLAGKSNVTAPFGGDSDATVLAGLSISFLKLSR